MNTNLKKGVVELSTDAIKRIDNLIENLKIDKGRFQEVIDNSESEDFIEAFDHAINEVDYDLRITQNDFRFSLRMLLTDLNYFINNSEGGLK
jgi:coenzyme F420-reducing hydrogenase delta subunit